MTLALKLFRGEPAISKFVWHFTPNHSSSPLCNIHRFGPPRDITLASTWPWLAHQVSCLLPATDALFRLAFATAPAVTALTLPQKVTRRLILQKARRHPYPQGGIVLRLVVSTRFQVLFHSPRRGTFHLSLTVLVHYRSPRVFSLGRWSPQLPTGLACPWYSGYPGVYPISLRGCHPLWSTFPV
jgi:hypothetical protein